jgi:hypothetical protein
MEEAHNLLRLHNRAAPRADDTPKAWPPAMPQMIAVLRCA